MTVRWSTLAATMLAACLASTTSWGQVAASDLVSAASAPPAGEKLVSPSRVLSGVRGYPSELIEALATLGGHRDWLDRSASRVRENKPLEFDAADMPADVKTALTKLSRTPELIVIAASHPDEAAMLHSIQTDAPEGGALRLSQLRVAYDMATRKAAAAWQQALESDPVAFGEYRELLTRFCRELARANEGFATVAVTDRAYYGAVLPDEGIMAFAEDQKAPQAISRLLQRWWDDHGKPAVDAEAAAPLEGRRPSLSASNSVYELSAADRKGMWKPIPDATKYVEGDSLGLVPVILQPPVDQPEEARLAFAINEHARLWSLDEVDGQDDASPPQQAPAIADSGQPAPGPTSAGGVKEVPAYDPGTAPREPPQPSTVYTQPPVAEEPPPTVVYRDRDPPVVVYGDDVDVDVDDGVVVIERDDDWVTPVYVAPAYGYTYTTVFGYPTYCYPYVSYYCPPTPCYTSVWWGPRYYPTCYAGGYYNGYYGSVAVGGFGFAFGWRSNDCYRYGSRVVAYGGGRYGGGRIYARPTPYRGGYYDGRYYGGGRHYDRNGRLYGTDGRRYGTVNYGNNGVRRDGRNYFGSRGLYATGSQGTYATGNRGLYPRINDAIGRRGGGDGSSAAGGRRDGAAGGGPRQPGATAGRGGTIRDLLRGDVARRDGAGPRDGFRNGLRSFAPDRTGEAAPAGRGGAIRNLLGRGNAAGAPNGGLNSSNAGAGRPQLQNIRERLGIGNRSGGSAAPRDGVNRPSPSLRNIGNPQRSGNAARPPGGSQTIRNGFRPSAGGGSQTIRNGFRPSANGSGAPRSAVAPLRNGGGRTPFASIGGAPRAAGGGSRAIAPRGSGGAPRFGSALRSGGGGRGGAFGRPVGGGRGGAGGR